MTITRRALMAHGLVAIAGLPFMAAGMRLSHASMQLGQKTIETISDGQLIMPASFSHGAMPADQLAPILEKYGISSGQIHRDCNMTMVRDGERAILFDVGSGSNFMPSAGKSLEALEAMDLSVEDITHVVFTHAHPDHLWGLLDDFDDPVYPNATYLIGKSEWDYWMDERTVETIGEARQSFAVGAKSRLEAIEDNVTTFGDGEEILPGIAARATFGHTPGHMAFEVRDGSNAAMIVGDAIGDHYVAFEKPLWETGSDQDPVVGAKTRASLLDQISHDKMQLIGFHLPNGGIGHAEREGDAYRFLSDQSSSGAAS